MEPITMILLGAGAAYLVSRSHKNPNLGGGAALVRIKGGKTGRDWLTRVLSVVGAGDDKQTTVQVYAPAGSYGPHNQVLVAVYEQRGSDTSSRKIVSLGPDALPQMVTDAGQDFAIHKN